MNSMQFSLTPLCIPRISWMMLLVITLGLTSRTQGVERTLEIQVPAKIASGQEFSASFFAKTDAGQGEQVGFLQVDMSLDEGKTWVAICYLDKAGPEVTNRVNVTPGAAESTVRFRARAAFRGGLAGDVDYRGAAIRWNDDWAAWKTPPAKHVTAKVTAP